MLRRRHPHPQPQHPPPRHHPTTTTTSSSKATPSDPPRPSPSVSSRPTDLSFGHSVVANRIADVRRVLRDPRSRLFVDFNAKVAGRGGGGTPLVAAAAEAGHLWIVHLLLREESVRPDAADAQGNTALHLAAANGRLDVVKVLTNCPRVGLRTRNHRNQTAAELAREILARSGRGGHHGIEQCLRHLDPFQLPSPSSSTSEQCSSLSSTPKTHMHKPIVPPRSNSSFLYNEGLASRRVFQQPPPAALTPAYGKGDLRERLQAMSMKKTTARSPFVWVKDRSNNNNNDNNNLTNRSWGHQMAASNVKIPPPPWVTERRSQSVCKGQLAYQEEDVKYEVYEVEDSESDTDVATDKGH